MPSWSKRVGLAAGALLLGIQFIPVNRRNPPVDPSKTIYASQAVPANVRAVLERSCQDCHSNQTVWPWYSYVAPVSWVVAHDVHQARGKMNFSEWATYAEKKKADRRESICDEVMNDDMPDGKYAFVHRRARLTQDEREAICEWTQGGD